MKEQPTYYTYNSPWGKITLAAYDEQLIYARFGTITLPALYEPQEYTNKAATELLEYFAGKRQEFSLRLHPYGTEFQQEVWDAICAIPYGTTTSYAELAQAINKPESLQAVGQAVYRNPLLIFIPSHRVLGKYNKPWRYPAGTTAQQQLLDLEAAIH